MLSALCSRILVFLLAPVLALPLLCVLASPHALAATPDFEEDLTLGLGAAELKKLGAAPCPQAALCLTVRWQDQDWKAALRLQADKLETVELQPADKATAKPGAKPGPKLSGHTVRQQLDELALAPVLVVVGTVRCDAFALVKSGMSAEKAVNQCTAKAEQVLPGADFSLWYVDEDEAEKMLTEASLEKAASANPRVTGARLSVTAGAVEVGYGVISSLLQPVLKP